MGGKREYNYETFAPGTRVKVHAALPMEGTDHDWHGHYGTVMRNGMWTLVRVDKRKRDWPGREVLLCNHNLRLAAATMEKPHG